MDGRLTGPIGLHGGTLHWQVPRLNLSLASSVKSILIGHTAVGQYCLVAEKACKEFVRKHVAKSK